MRTATITADLPALYYTHPDASARLTTIPAGTVVEIDETIWDQSEGTRHLVSAMVETFRAYAEAPAAAIDAPRVRTLAERES